MLILSTTKIYWRCKFIDRQPFCHCYAQRGREREREMTDCHEWVMRKWRNDSYFLACFYLVGHTGPEDVQRPVNRRLDESVCVRLSNPENERGRHVADVSASFDRRRPGVRLEEIGLDKLQKRSVIDEPLCDKERSRETTSVGRKWVPSLSFEVSMLNSSATPPRGSPREVCVAVRGKKYTVVLAGILAERFPRGDWWSG